VIATERRRLEEMAWTRFFAALDPREAVLYADLLDELYVGDPVAVALALSLRAGELRLG
jgi:hypothetical protein